MQEHMGLSSTCRRLFQYYPDMMSAITVGKVWLCEDGELNFLVGLDEHKLVTDSIADIPVDEATHNLLR